MLPLLALVALAGQSNPEWTQPIPPFRVVGNLYYVGSKDLASYLIVTPKGDILINGNLPSSPPLIKASIEKLGFRLRDVKILLISHAHGDHCGGCEEIKRLTGARYMVMKPDVGVVEDGGKSDFAYRDSKTMHFPEARVDRVLHDGDIVRLGSTTLTAHLTAGHTKGCTTWTLRESDGKRTYNVVIVGGPNVNSEYKLVHNPLYPEIAADYKRQFQTLRSLPCDIFLGAHGIYFDMLRKLSHRSLAGSNPFYDPTGYRSYVLDREKVFEGHLAKQEESNR